jgi:hypothetical protein
VAVLLHALLLLIPAQPGPVPRPGRARPLAVVLAKAWPAAQGTPETERNLAEMEPAPAPPERRSAPEAALSSTPGPTSAEELQAVAPVVPGASAPEFRNARPPGDGGPPARPGEPPRVAAARGNRHSQPGCLHAPAAAGELALGCDNGERPVRWHGPAGRNGNRGPLAGGGRQPQRDAQNPGRRNTVRPGRGLEPHESAGRARHDVPHLRRPGRSDVRMAGALPPGRRGTGRG